MNIENKHVHLASAFFVGVTVGALTVKVFVEKKIREEMTLEITSIENSYEAAIALRDARENLENTRLISEAELKSLSLDPEPNAFGETLVVDKPITEVDAPDYLRDVNVTATAQEPVKNQYHQALEATETPVEQFVDGGVNDYGVSYIEDEDYLDEDGRFKGKIDIMLTDSEPVFLMDGAQIEDWDKRIGDSILVDMFRLCPPGTDPILYVRNHRTDEDYEVVRVEP